MLCTYIACNRYTWHGCTIQHLDDGVIHVHVVLLADGRRRQLHCDLNACFPAGPGCDGLATGMSQPIFVETLFDKACFCPVLTLCKCTRGGYCMTIC